MKPLELLLSCVLARLRRAGQHSAILLGTAPEMPGCLLNRFLYRWLRQNEDGKETGAQPVEFSGCKGWSFNPKSRPLRILACIRLSGTTGSTGFKSVTPSFVGTGFCSPAMVLLSRAKRLISI